MGRGVTPLVLIALVGCRQVFGIGDTDLATDATISDDDAGDGRRHGARRRPQCSRRRRPVAPPGPPDAAGVCPPAYTMLGGGRSYRVVTAPETSWANAAADCDDDGAQTHLAVPDDATENAVIAAFISGQTWIGISDLNVETQYTAVTGQLLTFFNWENGEPDNEDDQDCVNMRDHLSGQPGAWRDDPCNLNRRYVCECP